MHWNCKNRPFLKFAQSHAQSQHQPPPIPRPAQPAEGTVQWLLTGGSTWMNRREIQTIQFLQQRSKLQKCWKYFRGCSNLARVDAAPSLQAGCWHGAVAEAQTAKLPTGLNALATETGRGKGGIMTSHALPLAKHSFSQGSAWPHNGKYSSMCIFLSARVTAL